MPARTCREWQEYAAARATDGRELSAAELIQLLRDWEESLEDPRAVTMAKVVLTTPHGRQYDAWKIRVSGLVLILTTAELDKAQQRARDYLRNVRGRVARRSVDREVAAFEKAHPEV